MDTIEITVQETRAGSFHIPRSEWEEMKKQHPEWSDTDIAEKYLYEHQEKWDDINEWSEYIDHEVIDIS